MKNQKKLLKQLLFVGATAGVLSGCGQGGQVAGSGGSSFSGTPITISSTAVIPTFDGAPTSTVVYVHNNTNSTISNISYSVGNGSTRSFDRLAAHFLQLFGISTAVSSVSSNSLVINPTSASGCATIPANGSCTLGITTPAEVTQGTSVVNVSYQYNKQDRNFTIPVSYSQQALESAGVYTTGGVMAFNNGNNVAYGTVYAYGGGSGLNYLINSLTSSNAGVIINNKTISVGQEMSSKQVVAIELKSPLQSTSSQEFSVRADINIAATNGSNSYSALATYAGVRTTGAYLAIPLITPMDTAESTASTTAYAYNYGNAGATGVSLGAITGLTQSGSTCGATLAAGASCQVTLTPTVAGSQGTGTLTASYSGGSNSSTSQTVNWYNSIPNPLLSVSVPATISTLAATDTSATVTISNPAGTSGVPFTISTVTASNITGTATLTPGANSCDGTTLAVGGPSCSYTFTFNNTTAITNGAIKVSIAGNYKDPTSGATVNRTQLAQVSYITTANQAVLTASPLNPTLTVLGDGESITYQDVVITNSGSGTATAAIGTVGLTNTGGESFSISSDGCASQVLSTGASCTVTLKLGSQVNNDSTALTGSESFTVDYTSSGQAAPSPLSTLAYYTVNPNNQSVIISSVTFSGTASGTGATGSHAVFSGNSSASGQTVQLTYQNNGTNSVTINGFEDANNSMQWSKTIDNCSGVTLAVNATCTVTYTNVLATYASGLQGTLGATYGRNLHSAGVVFVDDTDGLFALQPTFPVANGGASQLYVDNQQATITNSATYSTPTLTVTNTIANTQSYSSYSFAMNTESYFTAATTTGAPSGGATGDCSQASSSSTYLWTTTCAVPAGTIAGAYVNAYTYNTALGTNSQDMLFKFGSGVNTAGGYIIDMSPLYITKTAN